jgi:hypothetical protein
MNLQQSLCTASKVIRSSGPCWFHGAWLHKDQTAASGQTIGLVASGTSGTWTQSKVIIPYQKITDTEYSTGFKPLMVIGGGNAIRCADGLWCYLPKIAAGGSTIMVVWS